MSCFKRKPKPSRHIRLNPTNIALLLQGATQKYWKLTNYWTKSCFLLLPSSTTQYSANFKFHKQWRLYSFIFWFENGFLQVKPARYHYLHKNCVYNDFTLLFHVFNYRLKFLRTPFSQNTSGRVLLKNICEWLILHFWKLFCKNILHIIT